MIDTAWRRSDFAAPGWSASVRACAGADVVGAAVGAGAGEADGPEEGAGATPAGIGAAGEPGPASPPQPAGATSTTASEAASQRVRVIALCLGRRPSRLKRCNARRTCVRYGVREDVAM